MDDIKQGSEQEVLQTEAQQAEAQQTEVQPQQSYAVRPQRHHHRRLEYSDRSNMLGVRNALNIAFMLFAIVGVVLFYQMEDRIVAYILLIIGVVLKIAEVCIRMFKK